MKLERFQSKGGLSYVEQGAGPAVLLLHGFGGHAGFWRPQIEALGSDFRVVAADLPGHGHSPWQAKDLKEIASMMLALGRELETGPWVVAGSSFGGLVALEMSRQQPAAVRVMVFAGSLPRFIRDEGYPAALDKNRIDQLGRQLHGDTQAVLEMFFRSVLSAEERRRDLGMLRGLVREAPVADLRALDMLLEALKSADFREYLRTVNCPREYIFGAEDPLAPEAVCEAVRELESAAGWTIVKGAGHFPALTRPEEVNRIIRRVVL